MLYEQTLAPSFQYGCEYQELMWKERRTKGEPNKNQLTSNICGVDGREKMNEEMQRWLKLQYHEKDLGLQQWQKKLWDEYDEKSVWLWLVCNEVGELEFSYMRMA